MNEQIAYLCETIKGIKRTEEFEKYIEITNKLKDNKIYQDNLAIIKSKEYKDEQYYSAKKIVNSYQVELKQYENIINKNLDKVIQKYKNLFEEKCE